MASTTFLYASSSDTLVLPAVGANILLTVLDGRVAVQGVEMREAELLVIRITKIEILDEWVVSHRAFGGVFTTAILIQIWLKE